MSVKQAVERAFSAQYSLPDEGSVEVEFREPLTSFELDLIASEAGAPLPQDYREMAMLFGGIECEYELDLSSKGAGMKHEELLPKSVTIALDGFGNSWEVDLVGSNEERSMIYYLCHDAPVLLFQCKGIDVFLNYLVDTYAPPHRSMINQVEDDNFFDVWRMNPGVVPVSEARKSENATIRQFAEHLDENFMIVDLRDAPVGMGLSWGRYGPESKIVRCGALPIFAYGAPHAKTGLLSRLFGKKR